MIEVDGFSIRRRACTCGPPPERCLADETFLTQQTWDLAKDGYRNNPRVERETAVSMLIGDHWTVESASVYVYRGKAVPPRKLAGAAIRVTTAGRLRAAGFAVVHTPGDIVNGPHVSIVWPDSNPLDQQTVPWPADVSALFDACFNGVEGDAT